MVRSADAWRRRLEAWFRFLATPRTEG